ncbi:hypothetical protein I8U24_10495 [Thermoactinomyces sp. CICC 24226]|nr:hypothetical protein [Thermoactinomyces sp. CICC 24226]
MTFVAEARMEEFYNALRQLGVPAENQHIEYLDDPNSDGGENVTVNEAKSVFMIRFACSQVDSGQT